MKYAINKSIIRQVSYLRASRITHGLLRQYFPKGSCFEDVSEAKVKAAVEKLNHRPRKILGFKTPFEVFWGKMMRYTASPLEVALRNLNLRGKKSKPALGLCNIAAIELL